MLVAHAYIIPCINWRVEKSLRLEAELQLAHDMHTLNTFSVFRISYVEQSQVIVRSFDEAF